MQLKQTIVSFFLTMFTITLITPCDAALILKTDRLADKIISAELKNDVYHIETLKQNLFLGIFKTTSKIETKISSKTGQVLEIKNPWYSKIFGGFLFREIKN